jgi:predicted transglutaminase-like cysteine proteinase
MVHDRTLRALALAGSLSLAFAFPASSQATSLAIYVPHAMALIPFQHTARCASLADSNLGQGVNDLANPHSKASAILGRQRSRLEQIALAQSGQIGALPVPSAIRMEQAPGTTALPGTDCDNFASLGFQPTAATLGLERGQLDTDTFLDSKRIAVRRSPFDRQWARVKDSTLGVGRSSPLSRITRNKQGIDLLSAVNAWSNDKIRYAEDDRIYGRADFWADARTTLRRGAGDCEDIAIVKLQLLAALGVKRSDMFLTVARDLARNNDHAMLIVRMDGRNWLLDNSTPVVLDARQSHDYRPILSYSSQGKWLHGY